MADNNIRAWHAVITKGSAALKKKLTAKHGDKPEFQQLLKRTGQDKETWYLMHQKKQARLRGETPAATKKKREEIGLKAWGATKGTRMGGEEGGGLTTDAPEKSSKTDAVPGQYRGAGPVKTLSVAEYMKQKEKEKRLEMAKKILLGRAKMNEEGLDKACWKGYTAIGMKKKNGKKVPNCVPVSEEETNKLKGTPVVSFSDFTSKDYTKNRGKTVPKKLKKDDPRVKFHKDTMEEAATSDNTGYGKGYHGNVGVDDKKYSSMHTKVKRLVGAAGHLSDVKKPNVMVKHFLDSTHGRHIADQPSDSNITSRFKKFKNTYNPEMHESIDEGMTKAINKKMKNTLSAIRGRASLGAPEKEFSWQQNKAKAVKTGRAMAKEEVDQMDEAHKIGSKVQIVKGAGKGIQGVVGEIRHGAYKGAPKTYTVFHGEHDAIQVPKEHIRAMKEEVEQMDEAESYAEYKAKHSKQLDIERKVIKHNKAIDKMQRASKHGTIDHSHPDLLKTVPKGHGVSSDGRIHKKMKEEAEQMNELSRNTLRDYVGKAYADRKGRKGKNAVAAMTGTLDDYLKGAKKSDNRSTGITRAYARLNKEEVEQMNEKHLTPAERKKREQIAQAMERKNPGMDMSKKMAIATAQAKKVAEGYGPKRYGSREDDQGDGPEPNSDKKFPYSGQNKSSWAQVHVNGKKVKEFHGTTSYDDARDHAHELDYFHKKSGEKHKIEISTHSQPNQKIRVNEQEQMDGQYTLHAVHDESGKKKHLGTFGSKKDAADHVEKMGNRFPSGHEAVLTSNKTGEKHMYTDKWEKMDEGFEQIDELDNKTLGSYIKKASHDVATKGALVRHFATKSKDEKSKDNFMQARKDDETSNKIFNKSWKRREGIAKAVDRLTKEEVEQMDELNKGLGSHLSRYVRKATDDFGPRRGREAGVRLALKKMLGNKKYGLDEPKVKAVQRESLDRVGKESPDIDNDKDVDRTDLYLHNKRNAIKKAITKKKLDEGKAAAVADRAIQLQRGKKNKINKTPEIKLDLKAHQAPTEASPTNGEDKNA